jgi:hypothetical protein
VREVLVAAVPRRLRGIRMLATFGEGLGQRRWIHNSAPAAGTCAFVIIN